LQNSTSPFTSLDAEQFESADVIEHAVVNLPLNDDISLLGETSMMVRVFDIVVSGLLLLLSLPLLLGVALAIRLDGPGPILFRQQRPGRNGERFTILKFRTMIPNATEQLELLLAEDDEFQSEFERSAKVQRDPRISNVGRVLRPAGLDELPQLWNVLRGDMSIVGPRPMTIGEEGRYGLYAPLVWTVKPGLTGAWQIGGRSDITYAQRVAIDVLYVRTRTIIGDIRILFRTVFQFMTFRLRGGY